MRRRHRRGWHMRTPLLVTGLNIETSYLVYMHFFPLYMDNKYFVILAYSFLMAAILVLCSLICYPAHIDSHRDFILHTLMYIFFAYVYKRNNATVTYFLKFLSIYSLLLLETLCAVTDGSLSCTFLANYVPKCQTSSDPYGSVFLYTVGAVYCHNF